jgi:hypothetical protein
MFHADEVGEVSTGALCARRWQMHPEMREVAASRTIRQRMWMVAVGLALPAVASCGATDRVSKPEPSTPQPVAVTNVIREVTSSVTVPPLPTLPRNQLDSCVEAGKFYAFTGDSFWSEVWANAEQSDENLRGACEYFELSNPGWLGDVHSDWLSAQRFFAAAEPPATTTAPKQADPSLVTACVDWVEWYAFTGDAKANQVWQGVDESPSRLRAFCEGFAVENPGDALALQQDIKNVQRFLSTPRPAPVNTNPPVVVSNSGCHPNYSGCVPIASDVDCAGGSGNGPAYTGRVTVLGPDVYGLDRDGDGIGCE